VDGVGRAVLLRHPDNAHAENDVGHPSEGVVGFLGSVARDITQVPYLRHTPRGTTGTKDLKDPLKEESESKSTDLNELHGSGGRISLSSLGDPHLRVDNSAFEVGRGRVSEEHTDETKAEHNVRGDSQVIVSSNRVVSGSATQVPDLTHTPDGTTSAKDFEHPLEKNANDEKEKLHLA